MRTTAEFKISLAAARVNAGYTQREVAATMHKTLNTICKWERGQNEIPASAFREMCKLYKIDEAYVFLPTELVSS